MGLIKGALDVVTFGLIDTLAGRTKFVIIDSPENAGIAKSALRAAGIKASFPLGTNLAGLAVTEEDFDKAVEVLTDLDR